MSEQEVSHLDKEIIKMLAETVADRIGNKLRDEARDENARLRLELKEELRLEIQREFKNHFGDMQPSTHIVQHARIDRFLNTVDKLSDNFWGRVIGNILLWGAAATVLGYVFFSGSHNAIPAIPH